MEEDLALDQFTQFLRKNGHNVTQARSLIAKAALAMDRHFEAADLWAKLKKEHPVSVSTVYRTLNLLVQAGLLRVTDLGDPHAHYEVAGETHHEHLVCTQCGQVVEVEDEKLLAAIGRVAHAYGFHTQGHSLRIFGLCPHCRERAGK